jgi:putative ABC transport system permease protein
MRARDLTGETMLSLTANTARSFLTILGIVIGIVSVIVMISIGDATKASITGPAPGTSRLRTRRRWPRFPGWLRWPPNRPGSTP